ncbi:MAG: SCP2 sterol-binding domain-containing protein [Salinisphaera sp.]|nr:SCP2 sterol-binding domain-containing protein [Salinisphaera sp.]
MRLPGEVLGALEIALNRILDDPQARAEAARLRGRTLALVLTPLDLELVLWPEGHGLRVSDEPVAQPDVRLAGDFAAFARHLFGAGEMLGGGIRIEGDALLAQAFARLLRRAEFDPEDWLAGSLGDVGAELVGRVARSTWGVLRRAANTFALDAAEFLREESRDLVHREEIIAWGGEVDRLRADSDRLAMRLRRLARRQVSPDAHP